MSNDESGVSRTSDTNAASAEDSSVVGPDPTPQMRESTGEVVKILVATGSRVLVVTPDGTVANASGLDATAPTCLASDPETPGRAWCGTHRTGIFRSLDWGASWEPCGLEEERITAVAASPRASGLLWAGTEPSAVWRSDDGGIHWTRTRPVDGLPSASEWSFPPKPDTHHVRWIGCHPEDSGRLWVAVEAGALIRTTDGGRSWRDRAPGGPVDTRELAVHPLRPETIHVAAGDGYFESPDGGDNWRSRSTGLDVGYLRSVAIDPGDPDLVVVSGASRPRTAYVAPHADGRIYRRSGEEPWTRVIDGWPDPPTSIAPLLVPGAKKGELWAADERELRRTDDGARSWRAVARLPPGTTSLRGLVLLRE